MCRLSLNRRAQSTTDSARHNPHIAIAIEALALCCGLEMFNLWLTMNRPGVYDGANQVHTNNAPTMAEVP